MNDGIFFDDCKEVEENWDDDWVVCPVCGGAVEYGIDNDGNPVTTVYHIEVNYELH